MKSRETLIRLRKFQVDEKRRRTVQIETMIAEFERMSVELEREVKVEQDRAGIQDPVAFRLSDLCQGREPAQREPEALDRRPAGAARRRQGGARGSLRGIEEGRIARRARPGARPRRCQCARADGARFHRHHAHPQRGAGVSFARKPDQF